MYICSIVPYSLKIFGEKLGPKGLGRGGVYAMYSMGVCLNGFDEGKVIYLRRLCTDRKAGIDFHCPFIVLSSVVLQLVKPYCTAFSSIHKVVSLISPSKK